MEIQKVVILQDNNESIDLIKSVINEIDGFSVEGASVDGEEGLSLIEKIKPDFLIIGIILKCIERNR